MIFLQLTVVLADVFMLYILVAYLGGGACGHENFLTRDTVKNGISNLYILFKSALKMHEMPFQRPKFQKISGGHAPLVLCRHYGLPSLKSWLRYWLYDTS